MMKAKMFFFLILFFFYLSCTPFAGTIRIISPNGSERYYVNSTINIKWISLDSSIVYVKIELYKDGELNTTITENTENTGEYNWLIPENQNPEQTYKIVIRNVSEPSNSDQSDSSFIISKSKRVPAEWEEVEAVLVSWDSSITNEQVKLEIKNIIKEISNIVKVYVVVNDYAEQSSVNAALDSFGVNMNNISFFYYAYSGRSIWIRNYAPIFFFENGILKILDFDYYDTNFFPIDFATQLEIPFIDANDKLDLSGGNFISDGRNTSITTLGIYMAHPEYGDYGYFNQNCETIEEVLVKLSEYTSNKHSIATNFIGSEFNIDFIAKMVSPTTFLVGQYADSIGNENATDNLIASQLTSEGYTVVRIPQPLYEGKTFVNKETSDYLNGKQTTAFVGTYTNSLILNDKILMPSYGVNDDTNAENIYKSVLSDYSVVKIECKNIMLLGGAIHSITKEIPKFDTVVSFSY